MCGISGQLNVDLRPVDLEQFKDMNGTLKHRGPDDTGIWHDAFIAMGHNRLSIIDLNHRSSQPMVSPDGRFVLVYNGEIYNYIELKRELQKLGYRFKTESDTEVVLMALINWNEHALQKFNGMFALAFYDSREKSLFLARDRYGIKPLYYRMNNGTITFASEIKTFKKEKNFSSELNLSALVEYLTFQNIFSDISLTKEIELLPAGHFMKINTRRSSQPKITQYWDFDFHQTRKVDSESEYMVELVRLLEISINRCLVGDVEVGAFLSGGMDSGSIVALASKKLPGLKTFTIGFDTKDSSINEIGYDERARAKLVASLYGTEHFEAILKSSSMEHDIDNVVRILEDPRMGQSYPNYSAVKLASTHVKVALSGTGGDELFGGYPWRYLNLNGKTSFENYINQYYQSWQRLISEDELKKLIQPIFNIVGDFSTKDTFRNVFQHHKDVLETEEDFINHSLYFESKTFLQGLLAIEDRLSMSQGLEIRVPFLDNDLVEFAMHCPTEYKINKNQRIEIIDENLPTNKKFEYQKKTSEGKNILRNTMNKLLPAEVIQAHKQGFSAPDSNWFREANRIFIQKRLYDKKNPLYEFLHFETAMNLIEGHMRGNQNRRLLIWSLLNLDIWVKENL